MAKQTDTLYSDDLTKILRDFVNAGFTVSPTTGSITGDYRSAARLIAKLTERIQLSEPAGWSSLADSDCPVCDGEPDEGNNPCVYCGART